MLHDVVGHEAERRALARSHAAGDLPTSLLLLGPRGIGKQRVALWTAQLVLCEAPSPEGPCDACRHCRRVRRLEHPDLHWHFPLPRPRGASSPEKLKDAIEEARGERLAELRTNPLRSSHEPDAVGIYLAAARTIRSRAGSRPSESGEQVFILADAEMLVPQESSPEAANALLKLLEEPPEDTRFILTSSEPGRLLDTIRSRSVPLHMGALPVDRVRDFLVGVAEVVPEEADGAARRSGGSIGMALGYLPDGDEPGPLEQSRRDAVRILQAAFGAPGDGYRLALADYGVSGGRGLSDLFDQLEQWIRDLAASATHRPDDVASRDASVWLERMVEQHRLHPVALADAIDLVEQARLEARGNVSPQLIIAGLVAELRDALGAASPVPATSIR